jgi:GNAT superfamily N-acetyltransferase
MNVARNDADVLIREAQESGDRAAVAELCRQTLFPEDTRDEAGLDRILWLSHGNGGEERLVAERGGEIVGVAFGSWTVDVKGTISGFITVIAVADAHRRRGIGAALLAELESRLWRAGAEKIWTGGSQPYFWWPGLDIRCDDALRLFTSNGYEVDEEVQNMSVVLSESAVSGYEPSDADLHRLSEEELPAFRAWMRATWEDEWCREVERVLDREPISCFVATDATGYLGFAAYNTNRLGWFGPMGTTQAARGRGIGTALLRRCLRDYLSQGYDECKICWAGPAKFYVDAVGASTDRVFARLRKNSLLK